MIMIPRSQHRHDQILHNGPTICLSQEVVYEGDENDAMVAGRIKSVANVNGSSRKSSISVRCRLQLLERWEGIKRNGEYCYTSSKATLIGELFAEVNDNDDNLVNQAFDLLEHHKNAYIEIWNQHTYDRFFDQAAAAQGCL